MCGTLSRTHQQGPGARRCPGLPEGSPLDTGRPTTGQQKRLYARKITACILKWPGEEMASSPLLPTPAYTLVPT